MAEPTEKRPDAAAEQEPEAVAIPEAKPVEPKADAAQGKAEGNPDRAQAGEAREPAVPEKEKRKWYQFGSNESSDEEEVEEGFAPTPSFWLKREVNGKIVNVPGPLLGTRFEHMTDMERAAILRRAVLAGNQPNAPLVDDDQRYIPPKKSNKDAKKPIYRTPNVHAGETYLPGSTDKAIDFVLVWEVEDPVPKDAETRSPYRVNYEARLRRAGLQLHYQDSVKDPNTRFLLIHAPFHALLPMAESLHLKMPLSKVYEGSKNLTEKILDKIGLGNPMMSPAYEGQERAIYRAVPVKADKVWSFLGSDEPEKFFRPSQRSAMVSHILDRSCFEQEPGATGIRQLLNNGTYTAAYPLHQGGDTVPQSHSVALGEDEHKLLPREELAVYWSNLKSWYRYQPLHKIRDYFGERVAFYFTWAGYYTLSLVPAAIAGLATFIYGLSTVSSDIVVQEVCQDSRLMCPTCDECKFWHLSDICLSLKSAHVFDNEATVLYGLFMCLWASVVLELWKRKAALTARQWSSDGHEIQEPVRAEYASKAKRMAPNVITGDLEPHIAQQKWALYLSVYMIVSLFLCVVAIYLVSLIVYRSVVAHIGGEPYNSLASPLANVSASLINLLIMLFTRRIFSVVAERLTEFENHRTDSEYSNHLAFKLFVFDCANLFALPMYVAFFKGRFDGYPNHYNSGMMPYHGQPCGGFGCTLELAETLIIVMVGKLILDKLLDVVAWLAGLYRISLKSICMSLCGNAETGDGQMEEEKTNQFLNEDDSSVFDDSQLPRWEQDYKLTEPKALHWQYLEMVMQFGLVTVFGVAFPLAPLVALVNNILEIRLDAKNYVMHTSRMVAALAQDIGIWYTLLGILAKGAVITTALILTFTSNAIPKLMYRIWYGGNGSLAGFVQYSLAESVVYNPDDSGNHTCWYIGFRQADGDLSFDYWYLLNARLIFIALFEFVIFSTAGIIDYLVPDIPRSLKDELARELYRAKKVVDSSRWQFGADFDADPTDRNGSSSHPPAEDTATPLGEQSGAQK